MNATTRQLTQYLTLPTAPVDPRVYPQLSDLTRDITSGKASTINEFQKLLSRCYATGLYDGYHHLHWWRQEREQHAIGVIGQAERYGFGYDARSKQFFKY